MEQTAPTQDKTAKRPAADDKLVPPDEKFWQRYSPHGELPLSGAGSLALHLLVLGLMLLAFWLGYALFGRANRSLPVEAVRLDLGGGGGSPHGQGDQEGKGQAPVEAGPTQDGTPNPPPDEPKKLPDLKVDPGARTPLKFNDDALRYIHRTDTQAAKSFQRLHDSRFKVPDGKPRSVGKGGKGSGGGSGDGVGKSTGPGRGDGTGKLTQREKRMLRWTMKFQVNNAGQYLEQLRGLGAILAIPVREDGMSREYRIVRDLRPPVKLLKEDVSNIQRIYWIDDNPRSVKEMMAVLRFVGQPPSHFVAFMPKELEDKLLELEMDYQKQHNPGRTEDDIIETKFKINHLGNRYEPEVFEQRVK